MDGMEEEAHDRLRFGRTAGSATARVRLLRLLFTEDLTERTETFNLAVDLYFFSRPALYRAAEGGS